MKVIHVSAECYPVAKVGGLADVVGALPIYQTKLGVNSQVIMPLYNNAFTQGHGFKSVFTSHIKLGNKKIKTRILKLIKKDQLSYDIFFVDIPDLLHTKFVYSEDDTERFLAFQIAVLDWILSLKQVPNLIHCHDHHTGLIPFMMSHSNAYKSLKEIPTVLNIHNAQYQGWFDYNQAHLLPAYDKNMAGLLDWNDCINPLAAAIKCAWHIIAVSPSYMEELKTNANGLEALLSHESNKCSGILNGIDAAVWNPKTDPYLDENYNRTSVQAGKKAAKNKLCATYGLDPHKALFTFIGRLVVEKGADLFPEIFSKSLKKLDVSILLLGSGDPVVEKKLTTLKSTHKGQFNAHIGYDEALSHLIYAGADFLLMPSRVEPCGLNQMYALRYGTIPVVNNIGGLKDTIIDVSDNGFGFLHEEVSIDAVVNAMHRANNLYENTNEFKKIRKLIMQIDHSWDASAAAYINLYNTLI
ncbi:UNVERIFIED_CONTAM: hypothetical protein GTU68_039774 [Idotea baltica]|nr:hypothetical protein [Idotea baltica]